MPHVFVLEADPGLARDCLNRLTDAGFTSTLFASEKALLTALKAASRKADQPLSGALIDLSLCGSAPDFLRAIRNLEATRTAPLLLLAASSDEVHRLLGQELGAFACVAKPLSARERVSRLKALLRRVARPEAPRAAPRLNAETITIDPVAQSAALRGQELDLTRKEFDLLCYLVRHPNRVLSRERLLRDVWGLSYLGESRTIDAHIRRVRAKLGDAAPMIETVVGAGYRLKVQES